MYAAVASTLIQFGEELGLERAGLLEAARLRAEQLAEPDASIPFEAPILIWEHLLQRRPGQPLGLRLAEKMRPTSFGLAGHLFRHSDSVEQMLERMSTYQKLIDPALDVRLVRSRDEMRVEFHHEPRVLNLAHPLEGMVGAAAHTLRDWLGAKPELSLWFRHSPLHEPAIYQRYLDYSIAFEQPCNAVVLPAETLVRAIPDADAGVAEFLRGLAEQRLDEISDGSVSAQLRRVLEPRLAEPSLTQAEAAAALHMSVRTLQRRLRTEDTTYSEVLRETRQEMAKRLLRDPSYAVYQVAEQVGYTEAASFTRAFQAWTGLAPGEYARRHRL